MTFTVHYFKSGGHVAVERWLGKLPLAEAVARQAVASKSAERVEIRNANGKLVFEHPRVMHSV